MTGAPDPVAVRPLGVRRALVIGAGSSGRAAARLLVGAGAAVVLVEERGAAEVGPSVQLAAETGAEVVVGRPATEVFAGSFDLVVPSPGVPEHAPVFAAAMSAGTPVWSEPELALRRYPRRLLAVTGTNGKTSTTELLTAMCRAGGHDAHACGNIGLPVSDAAASSAASATLVAELSSFQLRFTSALAPEVAVLLNLAPDHLDWHTDLASYHTAKARIFAAQTSEQWAVAGEDDPVVRRLRDRAGPGRRAGFSTVGPVETGVGRVGGAGRDLLVATIDGSTEELLPVATLGPEGGPVPLHRIANVAAAATAALLDGVGAAAVAGAAAVTVPGRHRFEVVATDGRGVRYVDDSKATNVHAAMAALASAGPGVWIGGGLAKGIDLSPLAGALTDMHDAVVIGAAAEELSIVCASAGVRCHQATDLVAAVELAATLAAPGETVLLAPSCASFDQFDSYAHRGEVFTGAARRVATTTPGPTGKGTRR